MVSINSLEFSIENIDHVLFDKDGTITDCHLYWGQIIKLRAEALCTVFDLPFELNTAIQLMMGFDSHLNKLLPQGPIAIKSRKEVIETLVSRLYCHNSLITYDSVDTLFKEIHPQFLESADKYIVELPGSMKLIKDLSQYGVSISMVTSDSTEAAIRALQYLNVADYFQYIIGGNQDFGPKDNGHAATYICNKLHASPARSIVIGDTSTDSQMALNAGISKTILVATGQIPEQTLRESSSFVCANLTELTLN